MNMEELIGRFTEELWSFSHGYVSRDDVRTIVDAYRSMGDRAEAAEAKVARLTDALANTLGHLDTPISRRKIGLTDIPPWLVEARAALKAMDETQ